MKLGLLVSLILAISGCATSNQGSEFEPKSSPLSIGEISNIHIKAAGQTSRAATNDGACAGFTMSQAEIDAFFSHTNQVAEHDYHHMLDWSPCYIEGDLTLDDGQKATWAIHQLKAGSIVLTNEETVYIYCPECKAENFLVD